MSIRVLRQVIGAGVNRDGGPVAACGADGIGEIAAGMNVDFRGAGSDRQQQGGEKKIERVSCLFLSWLIP